MSLRTYAFVMAAMAAASGPGWTQGRAGSGAAAHVTGVLAPESGELSAGQRRRLGWRLGRRHARLDGRAGGHDGHGRHDASRRLAKLDEFPGPRICRRCAAQKHRQPHVRHRGLLPDAEDQPRSRAAAAPPKATQADLVRYARAGAQPLDSPQLDPLTGVISWPLILREDTYKEARDALEQLYQQRASMGSLTGTNVARSSRPSALCRRT